VGSIGTPDDASRAALDAPSDSGGQPFTLTAELVDFQAMRIRLFRGPDPICEIHAADVEGQLAVASTDVRVPEACTTFLAQHDDFEAPLVNESFDPF
jgi:hypothetical protein